MLLGNVAPSQAAPKVASINVCTDQLAMLLADKDQLTSVSYLSLDHKTSYLADKAMTYPLNHGRAEEIFLQKPDLVLAGSFTARATVDLLRRLGFQVEEFRPASTFDDIRANIRRVGELLEQQTRAEALIAEIDQGLAEIELKKRTRTIALYYANNYTSGRGSLMDTVVRHAGFTNLADKLSLNGYGQMPLELLVMHKPDYLLMGERYDGAALAYQNYEHPALQAIKKQAVSVTLPDNLTVCGGPFTVEAVKILSDIAHE
ncbi:ABC transporter substrate-binding protein [Paenochrobactrum sp. BZR 588]|uniref:ABC transporter substrate-binding protein n=1 Tax=Paenochrobactrum TaxID=999488 RepID=UPI0035BC6190